MDEKTQNKNIFEMHNKFSMPNTNFKIDLEIGDTIKLTNDIESIILKIIPGNCKDCYCFNTHREVCNFRTLCENKIFALVSKLKKDT